MVNPGSSTQAKQARLAIRNNVLLGLIVAAFALLSLAFRLKYYVHYVKPLFGVAAFFFLIGGAEFVALARLKRRKNSEIAPLYRETEAGKEEFVVNDKFELDTTGENDVYERRLVLDGRPLRIRIPAKLFARAKSNATALVDDQDELGPKFRDFRSLAAERDPKFADEIKKLEIASILFVAPNEAQVYFTEESGGDDWGGVWDADRRIFRDLTMET